MTNDLKETICPWCASEIIWDPEIGPEEECPHCLNELGNYRTMSLALEVDEEVAKDNEDEKRQFKPIPKLEGIPDLGEDPTGMLDEDLFDDMLLTVPSVGSEMLQACIERQLEAPECYACRELMLHVGVQEKDSGYVPIVPDLLEVPIFQDPPQVNIFVCPTCYRVDYFLHEKSREALLNVFKPKS